MIPAPAISSPLWFAPPLPGDTRDHPPLSPVAVDEHWWPLQQAWLGAPEPRFNPGWARVRWSKSALHYDVILLGSAPSNRARALNERTWELGDVCELFLQSGASGQYVEIHVTPENQRLQLLWTRSGLATVREEKSPLEDFMVERPDWCESSTRVGPGFWVVNASLPWDCLGLNLASPLPPLRTAVSRYDCGETSDCILSSTAPLREPDYHRPDEWHTLILTSAPHVLAENLNRPHDLLRKD